MVAPGGVPARARYVPDLRPTCAQQNNNSVLITRFKIIVIKYI
jgi:hypothetical protein